MTAKVLTSLRYLAYVVLIVVVIGVFIPLKALSQNIGTLYGTSLLRGSVWALQVEMVSSDGLSLVDEMVTALQTLSGAVTANRIQTDIVTLPAGPATGNTHTTVADSATSVQIVASNTARRGLVCRNTSTAIMYVGRGITATTAMAEDVLPGGKWYEVDGYTGAVNAIWATDPGTGSAECDEVD